MASNQNYYDVLDVAPEATTDQIRSAFRRLARERHPDRFQGEVRRAAELDFQAITEAYNALSDPEQRARYDQGLKSHRSDAPTNPQDISRAYLAKAIGLFKSGQVAEAEHCFASSIAHDAANARAHHLYGMFLAQQPGKLDEALRHLDQAARLDSANPKVLVDASKMFARARMTARARRFAQQAVQIAPDDPGVVSWARELQNSGGRG